MTREQMLALRQRIEQDRADSLAKAADVAVHRGDPYELELALDAADRAEVRLQQLPRVENIREPGPYDEGSPHSFMRDLVASVSPFPVRGVSNVEASQRLQAHEMDVERRQRDLDDVSRRALSREGITPADGLSRRSISTASGAGGEFTPPVWLLEEWSSIARAAAPLRRLFRPVPLPSVGMSFTIPRITAAAGVVTATAQNAEPSESITGTDSLSVGVATFYGEAQISQQLLDRSDFDRLAMADLGEAYAQALEQQLVDGSGTSGEMLGLLNVSGATTVTWTQATPTPAEFTSMVASTAAQVADARLRPPSFVLMRPGRWFWTAGTADGSGNEPTVRPGTGLIGADPDVGPVGPVASLPVYLDAELPNDLGTGSDQDVVVVARGRDLLLLEGHPKFHAFVDTAGAAENLTVVLAWHAYATAIPHRFPSSIGILTGTGLVTPSGF